MKALFIAALLFTLSACLGENGVPAAETATPSRTPFPTSVPLTDTPQPTPTETLRPSSTPLPTLTLPPSLTPVPTPTPTPGVIGIGVDFGPFRDDYSDPGSGWLVELTAEWGYEYFEGGYRMYNNMVNSDVGSSRSRTHSDFVISVEAHKLSGPNNAYYGVSCREAGLSYYTLGISGDGGYHILKVTGGVIEEIDSGTHPVIHSGNQSNHIVGSCIGNVLTLTVNGVEVTSIVDVGPLWGSFIGLVVGTTSIPGAEVKFDNFDSYPPEGAPPIPTNAPTETATPTMSPTP